MPRAPIGTTKCQVVDVGEVTADAYVEHFAREWWENGNVVVGIVPTPALDAESKGKECEPEEAIGVSWVDAVSFAREMYKRRDGDEWTQMVMKHKTLEGKFVMVMTKGVEGIIHVLAFTDKGMAKDKSRVRYTTIEKGSLEHELLRSCYWVDYPEICERDDTSEAELLEQREATVAGV